MEDAALALKEAVEVARRNAIPGTPVKVKTTTTHRGAKIIYSAQGMPCHTVAEVRSISDHMCVFQWMVAMTSKPPQLLPFLWPRLLELLIWIWNNPAVAACPCM